jgi:hypothetical protein
MDVRELAGDLVVIPDHSVQLVPNISAAQLNPA